jgi:hypothetical protein
MKSKKIVEKLIAGSVTESSYDDARAFLEGLIDSGTLGEEDSGESVVTINDVPLTLEQAEELLGDPDMYGVKMHEIYIHMDKYSSLPRALKEKLLRITRGGHGASFGPPSWYRPSVNCDKKTSFEKLEGILLRGEY